MRIVITGLSIFLMLIVMGCGSITMSLDTEVGQDAEAVHSVSLSATGEMADLMNQGLVEENAGELRDECQSDYSVGQFEMRCSGLTTSELVSQSSDGIGFDLEVVRSELPAHTEYRVSMTNPFWETQKELEGNPLAADGMDAIVEFRFQWNVSMPGEIVEAETNADIFNDGEAEFNISLDETRDTLVVVSRSQLKLVCRLLFGTAWAGILASVRQAVGSS